MQEMLGFGPSSELKFLVPTFGSYAPARASIPDCNQLQFLVVFRYTQESHVPSKGIKGLLVTLVILIGGLPETEMSDHNLSENAGMAVSGGQHHLYPGKGIPGVLGHLGTQGSDQGLISSD